MYQCCHPLLAVDCLRCCLAAALALPNAPVVHQPGRQNAHVVTGQHVGVLHPLCSVTRGNVAAKQAMGSLLRRTHRYRLVTDNMVHTVLVAVLELGHLFQSEVACSIPQKSGVFGEHVSGASGLDGIQLPQ